MADSTAKLAKVFRAANTVIRPLLLSPLHGLVSGRLMLLDYTGGTTGRHLLLSCRLRRLGRW